MSNNDSVEIERKFLISGFPNVVILTKLELF